MTICHNTILGKNLRFFSFGTSRPANICENLTREYVYYVKNTYDIVINFKEDIWNINTLTDII